RAAGRWLVERAAEFGFVLSFSRERHEARGVAFEPWHLRYVGRRTDDESGW
ncbi:MAG TPA: D-alanyl-D-alanine carboxypeptidase family protein, partial [bacterium]|nr:D-alanyl-D-alanine carboxypeptidase family protein [bacterium]